MRGADAFTGSLFSTRRLDDFVPASHPLRVIRKMTDAARVRMQPLFAGMYEADAQGGRPSVAPEKLLRAMLLQVLFSVRTELQLMQQVRSKLLFRWFIGPSMNDDAWVPTVFTRNRERLIGHDAVIAFCHQVLTIQRHPTLAQRPRPPSVSLGQDRQRTALHGPHPERPSPRPDRQRCRHTGRRFCRKRNRQDHERRAAHGAEQVDYRPSKRRQNSPRLHDLKQNRLAHPAGGAMLLCVGVIQRLLADKRRDIALFQTIQ